MVTMAHDNGEQRKEPVDALVVVRGPDDAWERLVAMVADPLPSPHSRRVYRAYLSEWRAWWEAQGRPPFVKATVTGWVAALQQRGLGSSGVNGRLAAIRKLALEAADNQLMPPDVAAAIGRVKGAKRLGSRLGNWLDEKAAQNLLNQPERETLKGKRDRAMLAVMIGCGLRRAEIASLRLDHLQQREGRWCLVDIEGKGGRIRTVPVPTWVWGAVNRWIEAAGIAEGAMFRPVNKGDRLAGESITPVVAWQALRSYSAGIGVPKLAPHDLRRTCAKLCRSGDAPIEQVQFLLGHASVATTERYLGGKLDLVHAANDGIRLEA